MSETPSSESSRGPGLFRSLGPAIIVASVVLGPGSILASSKVGWQFGYDMIWLLVGSCILLIGMTALSARLGVCFEGSLCDELAARAGRPLAVVAGGTLFLIAACFQFSNNLGLLFGIEPFLDGTILEKSKWFPTVVLVVFNLGIICALYGFRNLYTPIERLMKLLVGVMILGFAVNLIFAMPSVWEILTGLAPQLPEGVADKLVPRVQPTVGDAKPKFNDELILLQGLVATTFSVGGAFYTSYLVRQKGWTRSHLRQGLFDSVIGISTLALVSMMIMITAAAVLHDNPDVKVLKNAGDVARQLQPLFGPFATVLFCCGIFAGAFSSFLVNAMIGGTVLSDGLGCGSSMDGRWPKLFTVLGLVVGMGVAIATKSSKEFNLTNLIIFAQALTVLGNPLLAGVMLYLATRPDLNAQRAVPLWMKLLAALGFVVVSVLAVRLAYSIFLKLTLM